MLARRTDKTAIAERLRHHDTRAIRAGAGYSQRARQAARLSGGAEGNHDLARAYPWYDSPWLTNFKAARELIRIVRPDRLQDFIHAFDPLHTRPDFAPRKLASVFGAARLQDIRALVAELLPEILERHETGSFGRDVVHDHPYFCRLQRELLPLAGELAGEELEPGYNFLSLYRQAGVCEPHMDAPEAKWTLDVCIDQDQPWPIHFSQIVPWPEDVRFDVTDWEAAIKRSPDLHFQAQTLLPDEAVFFSGSSQWHYRDAMADAGGSFCNLLFFHYVPRGMGELLKPRNWGRLFDLPELDYVLVRPSRS